MGFSLAHPALLAAGLLAPAAAVAVWTLMPPPLSRRRSRLSLALRLVILVLVAAALSGLALDRVPRAQTVIAIADRSASTIPATDQQRRAVLALQRGLRRGDRLGVVTAGQQGLVEDPPAAAPGFTDFSTSPNPNYTNLEAGLRLAGSVMPVDTRRHVVVLSDGRQNLGDALSGARLLRSQGVRVDVLPVTVRTGDEARVDAVQVPSTLPAGATTQAQVLLNSNVAQPATLSVFLDQTLVSRVPVSLQVGETQVGVAIPAPAAGFHTVKAQLDPSRDTYAENNVGQALVQVLGPPRVLVVEGSPGEGANVAAALGAAALNPQVTQPAGMPDTLPALAAYQAVALVDVPAPALSTTQMQALQSGVRDLGIGLAAFGGAGSLGPGGYAGTPLDTTLPVTAQIPQQLRKPPVAVVLVLETMESSQADAVMRGAAKAVVDQLSPQDYVGVADGASGMLVPLQPATGKARIEQAIGSGEFGDPPSYAPYLDAAAQALATRPNANKHIVVVGDGDATDDYPGIGRGIAARGINISAIGINVESQPQFMAQLRSLAQAGGGSFYESDSPSQLPQLLLDETQKSLKPWIVQGTFTPQLGVPSPALGGTDPSTLPSVEGYVASTPKPAAEVVLRSPSNDPVLATWQYGLGRAVAWTSDTSGRWTAGLLAWPGAGKLLANIVGWTIPLGQDPALSLQATIAGDQGHVAVQLADPPTGGQVVASVAGPDLQGVQVPLSTTAPGRYEGSFPAGRTGSYLVKVTASDQGKAVHTALGGLALAYSAEYRFLGTDLPFLSELARAGGGSVLPDGAAAFHVPLPRVAVKTSLAFLLLAIATILLPFDVAARRLVLARGDLRAWSEAFHRRDSPAAVEPTLDRLRGRLDRLGAGPSRGPGPEPGAGPDPGQPAEEEPDLAARLLERRKKRGEDPR